MSIDRIYREFFGFSLIIFSLFLLASVLTFSAQANVVNIFNEKTTYQNNFCYIAALFSNKFFSSFYVNSLLEARPPTSNKGVLNPGNTGDIIQYAACPGPNEKQNMRSTFQYFGLRNGIMGGLEFVTLQPVPKNTQLLHWYGSGWWEERGIKRQDVGTKRYPAPLRESKQK